jgi:hypothetical protein
MVPVKHRVCKSNCLVGIHPDKLVCAVEDFLLKHLKLVALRCFFLGLFYAALQHEVLFENKSEAILHFHVEERAVVILDQQLDALDVVLLFLEEDQFERVKVGLSHVSSQCVDLLLVQWLTFSQQRFQVLLGYLVVLQVVRQVVS